MVDETRKEENKELEMIRKNKHLENLKRELIQANKQLGEIAKKKELLQRKMDIAKRSRVALLNNWEILNPTWAYEKDPEYLSSLKELNEVIFEETDLVWQSQLDGFDNNTKAVLDQIESLSKEKERIEKELNKNE